jgi:hypothetical protein
MEDRVDLVVVDQMAVQEEQEILVKVFVEEMLLEVPMVQEVEVLQQ